jgi:hypothetical protein
MVFKHLYKDSGTVAKLCLLATWFLVVERAPCLVLFAVLFVSSDNLRFSVDIWNTWVC